MTTISLEANSLTFLNTGLNFTSLTGTSDGLLTMSSNAGNVRISGASDPINNQDAATKNYVLNNSASAQPPDNSIQFNNAGSFAGSSDLLFSTNTMTLGAEASTSTLKAPDATTTTSAGGSIQILGGDGGSTSGNGGNVIIGTGTVTSGSPGIITVNVGNTKFFDLTSTDFLLTRRLDISSNNGFYWPSVSANMFLRSNGGFQYNSPSSHEFISQGNLLMRIFADTYDTLDVYPLKNNDGITIMANSDSLMGFNIKNGSNTYNASIFRDPQGSNNADLVISCDGHNSNLNTVRNGRCLKISYANRSSTFYGDVNKILAGGSTTLSHSLAAGRANSSGSTGDFNISTVTSGGTNIYRVNFTTPLPTANYCVFATTSQSNASRAWAILNTNASYFDFQQYSGNNSTPGSGIQAEFLIIY